MSYFNPAFLEPALVSQDNKQYFQTREPFPHAVFDNCFDLDLLRDLAASFPPLTSPGWQTFAREPENKKHTMRDLSTMPANLVAFFLESSTLYVLNWLERLTGITGLIPDPYLAGGGLHVIERGGWLNTHIDFNRHKELRLDRRLNVLIYLNDPWEEDWGGHLNLYNSVPCNDMPPLKYVPSGVARSVAPVLGRMVVFSTSHRSYHGHPAPLACPEGTVRKSLALYYYTAGRPDEEVLPEHSTVFFKEMVV